MVRRQRFAGIDPLDGRRLRLTNLIGRWNVEVPRRILLGAHHDTRPWAEEDPDRTRRREPYLGANDGASGVALLMELARLLGDRAGGDRDGLGVDLVLFDAEELVYEDREMGLDCGAFFLGSRRFAQSLSRWRRLGPVRDPKGEKEADDPVDPGDHRPARPNPYHAGLVLDMVAGPSLRFDQELFSYCYANRVVNEVWAVARRRRASAFVSSTGIAIGDDHLPLLEVGIPCALVIDIDDEAWHTTADRPERCRADSLAEVGAVVDDWLAQTASELCED